MVKTCDKCANWHRTDVGQGECRAHPPRVIVFSPVQLGTMAVHTRSDFWCGEYSPPLLQEAVQVGEHPMEWDWPEKADG
jgi:hypothetical protein